MLLDMQSLPQLSRSLRIASVAHTLPHAPVGSSSHCSAAADAQTTHGGNQQLRVDGVVHQLRLARICVWPDQQEGHGPAADPHVQGLEVQLLVQQALEWWLDPEWISACLGTACRRLSCQTVSVPCLWMERRKAQKLSVQG